MSLRNLLLAALVVTASALAGCVKCGPGNCSGCCSNDGVCENAAADHCGKGGESCVACPAGQQCLTGQCAFPGSSGGNGSGTTTGTTAGTTSGTTGATGTSAGTTTAGTTNATTGATGTSASHGSSGGTTASGTTTGGTSATTGTSAGTTTGASSSSGTTGACAVTDIATMRSGTVTPATNACLTDVVVVMASSFGSPKVDGGTQFDGKYWLIDPNTRDAVYAFKSKNLPPLSYDPQRSDAVDATGAVIYFPQDAGPGQLGQVELGTHYLDFTYVGSSAIPSPVPARLDQLDPNSADDSLLGKYVHVPAGSYSQDNTTPVFHVGTFYDGTQLTDSSTGHTVLVDTFTFKFSTGNCFPTDGGLPDLTQGNFNGVFDRSRTPDGQMHKVVFYGHCGQ